MDNSKEYQNFVKNYILKQIQERFNIKTKKEAKAIFWNVMAYNITQEELFNQIEYLLNNGEEDED